MKITFITCWCATVALVPQTLYGLHPLATDDAGTLGSRGMEVEFSQQAGRTVSGDHFELDYGMSFHLGLASNLDLGVSLPFQSSLIFDQREWQQTVGEPLIDLKWRFWASKNEVSSLALRFDFSPKQWVLGPLGGNDLGSVLISSWDWPKISLYLNFGFYARDIGTQEYFGTFFQSLALVLPISERIMFTVESTYEVGPKFDSHAVSGMAGMTLEMGSGQTFSVGGGPLWESGGETDLMATIGFTFSLPHE